MDSPPQFRLIRSSKSKKECYKLVEGGFIYGKQRVIGDVTHWQCEKRDSCKARIHTKGLMQLKRGTALIMLLLAVIIQIFGNSLLHLNVNRV